MTEKSLNKFKLKSISEIIKRFPILILWAVLSTTAIWWKRHTMFDPTRPSWMEHMFSALSLALFTYALIDFFGDWVKHRKKHLPDYFEKKFSTDASINLVTLGFKIALLIGLAFIFAFYFALAGVERVIGNHILLLGLCFSSLYLALTRFYFSTDEEWHRVLVGSFLCLVWRAAVAYFLYVSVFVFFKFVLPWYGYVPRFAIVDDLGVLTALLYFVFSLCLDVIALIREKRQARFKSVMNILAFALVFEIGILYFYFLKVLVEQKGPDRFVELLMILSVAGSFAFALYYRVAGATRYEMILRRWLLPLMVVPMGLMLTTLWMWVSRYGLTEARWAAVGVSGLFLVVFCVAVFKEVSVQKVLRAFSFVCLALSVGPVSTIEMTMWYHRRNFTQLSEQVLAKKSLSLYQEGRLLGSVSFLCAGHQEEFLDSWSTKNAMQIRTKDGCTPSRYATELKLNSRPLDEF